MPWLSNVRREVGVRPTLVLGLLVLLGCSSVVSPDSDRLGTGADATVGDGSTSDGTTGTDGSVVGDGGGTTDGGGRPDGTTGCAPGDPRCSGIGDPDSCGAAETRCRVDQICADGACTCRPGLTPTPDGACVDLASDPNNCGMVGAVCERGVCSGGHCAEACGDGQRLCEGACVGFSDLFNCGECGRTCNRDEICVRGNCREYAPLPCTTCPCDRCETQCCAYGAGTICLETEACPEP